MEIGWLKIRRLRTLFCFSGRKVWMKKRVNSGSKFVQMLSQEKRWAFGWGLCTQSHSSRICVLFYKYAWIHCWSLCLKHPVRSYILGGCFALQVLFTLCGCFIGEKSECPRKQFTHYSLWDQRHEILDLFEEPLLSQSLQPTLERRF